MIGVGELLRHWGLTARTLAAWAGTDRLSALEQKLRFMPVTEPTPVGDALELFVRGSALPIQRARRFDLDRLHAEHLVEVDRGHVSSRYAVLPLRAGFVVCDRLDVTPDRELVCWPDDSSYHLASALPAARTFARWLDLGCGSAFAQLAHPERARELVAIDLNPRAVLYADRGAWLSGVSIDTRKGDLADAIDDGRFDLVTCNAPIPEPSEELRPIWRATDLDFVPRVFHQAERVLADDGLVVVHAALDAVAPLVADLRGERTLVCYTPREAPRQFAVAWWAPGGSDRHVAARRVLSREHPHVTHDDRVAALDGSLLAL